MASDLMNVGSTGNYYKVQKNGKAQSGLSVGDRVVTDGGTYQILGVNADGTYKSALYDTNTTTKNYSGKYNNGYNSNGSSLADISSIKDSTKEAYDNAKNQNYRDSDSIKSAQSNYDSINSSQPSGYNSAYQAQIEKLMNQIENRDDFQYDMSADMLYQQYKDQYVNMGQNAMKDTMGQAASLTGGYGNSYAASAGSQAYQNYLQQLNDKVPDLYNLSLNKYQAEGDDLLNQYNMYMNADNTDYSKYLDSYNQWLTERNQAYNALQSETDRTQSDYYNNLNQMNNIINLENSDYWNGINQDNNEWQQNFQQSQFDYEKEQDALNRELAASKSSSGGSSGSSSSGSSGISSSGGSKASSAVTKILDSYLDSVSKSAYGSVYVGGTSSRLTADDIRAGLSSGALEVYYDPDKKEIIVGTPKYLDARNLN